MAQVVKLFYIEQNTAYVHDKTDSTRKQNKTEVSQKMPL